MINGPGGLAKAVCSVGVVPEVSTTKLSEIMVEKWPQVLIQYFQQNGISAISVTATVTRIEVLGLTSWWRVE